MKKKFDFSAEMAEAESIKSNPKNEYQEEENRLLDINAQELVKLNDNVFKLRTDVKNLSNSIRECKPIISEEMQKMAVEFGARLLCDFLSQIESKCKEAGQCHPYSGYHILYHHYNTGSPIFFFRQHDSGQCRNIAFSVDMESSRYLYSYCNFGDCHGYNRTEDFG